MTLWFIEWWDGFKWVPLVYRQSRAAARSDIAKERRIDGHKGQFARKLRVAKYQRVEGGVR